MLREKGAHRDGMTKEGTKRDGGGAQEEGPILTWCRKGVHVLKEGASWLRKGPE